MEHAARLARMRGPAILAALLLAILAPPARSADRPDGVAPIWEDPPGLLPVPIPWLRTPPANAAWPVADEDAVCGPRGRVGSTNVGQTFVPRTERIWRMDFVATNAHQASIDPRPGIVRIFKWQPGGYLATVAREPLFEHHIELSEFISPTLHVYPDLRFRPEEQDDTYFVEFSIPGKELDPPRPSRRPYGLHVVKSAQDPYPDGALYRSCTLFDGERPEGPPGREAVVFWDLWFEFHGSRPGAPAPRPLTPSDPRAPWYPPLRANDDDLRERYWQRLADHAAWHRPGALAPGGRVLHLDLLPEVFLYVACRRDGRCPRGLDEDELLANVISWLRKGVAERAECRNPQYPDCGIEFGALFGPSVAMLLLRDAGALEGLPPKLAEGIRRLVFERALARAWGQRKYGTNSWALMCMTAYLMYHALYPEHTPQEWIDYYRTIWRSWWEVRETEIDSDGYELWALHGILLAARYAPRIADASAWYADVWSDPHFRKLIDRFAERVTPIGTYPSYGDGVGVSLGGPVLIWLFEEAAARFGEPRYRELAQRLISYVERHARSRPRSAGAYWEPLASGPTFHALALAWLAAGDAPVPEPPAAPASLYTLRRRAVVTGDSLPPASAHVFSKSERPEADLPPSLLATAPGAQTRHYVPDKLILRSGGGSAGTSFVFNLLLGYSHGNPELGALASFTDRGSIVMTNVPYYYPLYPRYPQDESAPLLRHHYGGLADGSQRGTDVEVTRFQDSATATIAGLAWRDGYGWQVRQQRHLLFAKDRFLLVRDAFEAGPTRPGGITLSIGPVWHAADVHPEHDGSPDARDWYDVYHRQPLGNTTRFRNPERHALLYFVGREGYETAAYEEGAYLTLAGSPPPAGSLERHPACADPRDPLTAVPSAAPDCRDTPPFVLWQKWSGTLRTGEARWFDTLLLPHAGDAPSRVAARVRELAVGPDFTALQIDFDEETWIVVGNPSRRAISAARLTGALATPEPYLTDAESLLLRLRPGAPPSVVASQAGYVHTGAFARAFEPPFSGELGP